MITAMLTAACSAAPGIVQAQVFDPAFSAATNDVVSAIAVQADGKIIVGGAFSQVIGATRQRLARLNPDGSLDAAFTTGVTSLAVALDVDVIAVLPDGKILVAGGFTQLAGINKSRIARLLPDGTVDPTFTASVNNKIFSMLVQPDGRILIGGSFTSVNGTTRGRLARLNADGTLDGAFAPDVSGTVSAFALQPDGAILVGGAIGAVNGIGRIDVARLGAGGALDTSFAAPIVTFSGITSNVLAIAVRSDGKVLIGGQFNLQSGTDHRDLFAQLNPDGSLDTTFDVPVVGVANSGTLISHYVDAIVVQPDGRIVIGGRYGFVNGVNTFVVTRLLPDGSFDAGFGTTGGASGSNVVTAIAPQPDGKLVIAGAFGLTNIARLLSPTTNTVTPSTGVGGTISPSTPQSVSYGQTRTFTLTPAAGYAIDSVGGTCGGSLAGNVFTTAAVTANCTVVATFKSAPTPPTLSLNPTTLQFAAVNNGAAFTSQTPGQVAQLTQSGAGVVTWTATPSQPWLHVSPASGTGPAALTVTVSFVPGLPVSATLAGSIVFTAVGAANTPGPIAVGLVTRTSGAEPIGLIDTPADNRTGVTGAVPFTGWAVDETGLVSVAICRAPVAGEAAPPNGDCGGANEIGIGFAVMIDGARPDVAAGYPTYPGSTRAGWGFMVLTNMLPNQGNGTYVFHAWARDADGHSTLLGARTMTCANAQATLPFGTIDTPAQGGLVSGSSYVNFGWALTPQPKTIPTDGSTMSVFVDGQPQGRVTYNNYRPDIASLFPGLNNSNAAIGYRVLDTTAFTNGLHTIAWVVTDNQGAIEGLGSRFFTVANSPAATPAASTPAPPPTDTAAILALPLATGPVASRQGWDLAAPFAALTPDGSGPLIVRMEEVDRVELAVGAAAGRRLAGYLRTGDTLAPLPIGSSLDAATGVFTWAPGAGFVGAYDLVFLTLEGATPVARHEVRILIEPKGRGAVGPQVVIDTPTKQQDVGQPFLLAGWAADLDAAAGTGISTVHVWAYPLTGDAPIFLGVADRARRPDVAAVYGPQFVTAGYGLIVDGLTPGNYDLAVFAASVATGNFLPATVVRVTVR